MGSIIPYIQKITGFWFIARLWFFLYHSFTIWASQTILCRTLGAAQLIVLYTNPHHWEIPKTKNNKQMQTKWSWSAVPYWLNIKATNNGIIILNMVRKNLSLPRVAALNSPWGFPSIFSIFRFIKLRREAALGWLILGELSTQVRNTWYN